MPIGLEPERVSFVPDDLEGGRPHISSEYATFLAYPSSLPDLGCAAVLLDTRAIGGSVFAAVVPHVTTLKELRKAAGWDTVRPQDVFIVGCDAPLDDCQRVELKHGSLVKFVPPGAPPDWAPSLESASHLSSVDWDVLRIPCSPIASGALVLHADGIAHLSFFGNDDWRTMQQISELIDVPLCTVRVTAAYLPPGSSLVYRGRHVKGVLGVLPRPSCGSLDDSVPPTAVFLDCRPLGRDVVLAAFKGLIVSRHDLAAAIQLPALPCWELVVKGGRRCRDGFEVYHGETLILALRLVTCAAPSSCLSPLLSESEASDQEQDPALTGEGVPDRVRPLSSWANPPGLSLKTPSEGTDNLALAVRTIQEQGAVGHLPAPFHRLGELPPNTEGPLPAPDDHDLENEEDSVWHPTFMIYAMHTAPEEVQVTLRAPCDLETARGIVSAAMSDSRGRYYPHIVFADPQPTQYWGAVIALPGWAKRDPVVLLNLLELDDRCFVASLASPFSRAQVIRAAGLPPDSEVDVFAFREHIPMGPDRECDLVPGGTVTVRHPHEAIEFLWYKNMELGKIRRTSQSVHQHLEICNIWVSIVIDYVHLL
ncbi:unnamed protein product [Symbiodinium sp. CCMP2456]|nr:unnamed protein product [Symbiodinium sp. CCMP2456]